jgi:hypothetical protein
MKSTPFCFRLPSFFLHLRPNFVATRSRYAFTTDGFRVPCMNSQPPPVADYNQIAETSRAKYDSDIKAAKAEWPRNTSSQRCVDAG